MKQLGPGLLTAQLIFGLLTAVNGAVMVANQAPPSAVRFGLGLGLMIVGVAFLTLAGTALRLGRRSTRGASARRTSSSG